MQNNPVISSIQSLNTKLDILYHSNPDLTSQQLDVIKANIKDFLGGKSIELRFSLDRYQMRINDILVLALFTIYANETDTNTQIRAKQIVKNCIDIQLNPSLSYQIIATYTKGNNQFPITDMTDQVRAILNKTVEYYFEHLWTKWLTNNVGQDNVYTKGGFLALFYYTVTGGHGKRPQGGFPYFWNQFNEHPTKFQQPIASQAKLEKLLHTISDIVKYIYGSKDVARMNSFNSANKEIINLLKTSTSQKLWKVFEYVVDSKLDSSEIVSIDSDFKSEAEVTAAFQNLKKNAVSSQIDNVYQKYNLDLPPFKTWIASDLNKGPGDRGQLKADSPEIGRDQKGGLAKIKYNKFGDKSYDQINELRLFVKPCTRYLREIEISILQLALITFWLI